MSHLYWDTPFLSPLIAMDHKQLKRSRSNDAIDRTFKRPKPLQVQEVESPISITSEPITHTTPIYPSISPVPTHVQQHHYQQPSASVKSISISTRTLHQQQQQPIITTPITTNSYENINGILHNIHVERYGDPERRESWWKEDTEMEEDVSNYNTEYNRANSVLRQAFLTRHQHH